MKKVNKVTLIAVFLALVCFAEGGLLLSKRYYYHVNTKNIRKRVKEVKNTSEDGDDLVGNLKYEFSNEDIIAYLILDGIGVEYPIVQGVDNNYYLRRDLYGNYDENGSIFLDSDNSSDFSDKGSVIYGHNMFDGSMFGNLESHYSSQESFNNTGKTFIVITPREKLIYDIVSSCVIGKDDKSLVMGYNDSIDKIIDFLIYKSNIVNNGILYSSDSQILSLLTCHGDGSQYRFCVTGVLRRK